MSGGTNMLSRTGQNSTMAAEACRQAASYGPADAGAKAGKHAAISS
jgi:hypothetical protein